MFNLRYFVPVLALAAMALPAGASITDYCTGSGCGSNDQTVFTTAISTDGYTLQGLETFSSSELNGATYTDTTSGVVFTEAFTNNLAISGTALQDPIAFHSEAIVITLPATVLAIQLAVNVGAGLCLDSICPTGETSGFAGVVNTSPTGSWTVTLYPNGGDQTFQITNFDIATAGAQSGGGPGNGETPEVATFILIGFGLLAMRWMRRLPKRFFRTLQPAC